jgi:phage shock protein PspC (stress-responsive transcriptional regulator)
MSESKEVKRLHRSNEDRWLLGVCGGLAEYFNIDATLVRVLFVLFSFAVGGGIFLYLILWIVMPLEQPEFGETTEASSEEEGPE